MIKEIKDLIGKLKTMSMEKLSSGDFDSYMDMLSDLTFLKNSLSYNENELCMNLEVQDVLSKYSGVLA